MGSAEELRASVLHFQTTDGRNVALQIRHIVSIEEVVPSVGETSITTVNGEVYITTLEFEVVVAAVKTMLQA